MWKRIKSQEKMSTFYILIILLNLLFSFNYESIFDNLSLCVAGFVKLVTQFFMGQRYLNLTSYLIK